MTTFALPEPLDILAFAAHPDDAEVGCGGSLLLAAEAGLRVGVADLSAGEMSTRGDPQRRALETRRATQLLGLSSRHGLELPDTAIHNNDAQRARVVELLRLTRPRMLLAPYFEDRHPDHAAAGRLVRDARFLAGVAKYGEGRPYRPGALYWYMIHHPFPPSFVVDIGSVWDQKLAAIAAYESQFAPDFPAEDTELSDNSFDRALRARAVHYGAMIGAQYGEPFFAKGPLALAGLPMQQEPRTGSRDSSAYSMF